MAGKRQADKGIPAADGAGGADVSGLTLEENFTRLEETIGRLENEDISLEDAFAAYSEGMALLQQCNGQIDRVEKKVLKLAEDGGPEEWET
ncbi:MAG: exodeoxyribonuclease VII small subunit [Clostridium sp.]|nr:exodeoxyribonuclease VII small subunit [Acetatifactor muris]MCM1527017.1 exodeoxyribonuclease VII small subunit [Bacteroides sp.]MCM1561993.1 exodeoxyribonuclease VII small subunit [Clostridium sp.]